MNVNGSEYEILVAGGGLSGLTASLALARGGKTVANIAARQSEPDHRTTALLMDSVGFFDDLGVGAAIRRSAAPLATIRMIDDTGHLFRAPQVDFHASEIGLEAFGYNIANETLAEILREGAAVANVAFVDADVRTLDHAGDRCRVVCSGGQELHASLLVGADGRNSRIRRLANISHRQWSYPQIALVGSFSHQLPHDDASTEFHTPSGPFTIVPLGPKTASLVWVETVSKADEIAAWDRERVATEIERKMHSVLGRIEMISPLQSFPLKAMIAERFGVGRIALVGDSAHVLAPIGAQGFNLGIRDIRVLAQLAADEPLAESGKVAEKYGNRRFADVIARSAAVDMINRSLLTDFLPARIVHSVTLEALRSIAPLRRLAMREGIAPGMQTQRAADWFRSFFSNPPEHTTRNGSDPTFHGR